MAEPELLPPGPTPFELAQEETDAVRWPLPFERVKAVWNPWTCPENLLEYLARGLGLEIWHDDWSEQRKREVLADIWRLKRNKTKPKGLAGYLALEEARLIGAHRPRDKSWWTGGQSEAQRAASIALMPHIRIRVAVAPVAASRGKAFWSGRHVRQAWRPGRAWIASDAAARHAARATYLDRGLAAPVTVIGLDADLDASLRVELRVDATPERLFWGARRVWGRAAWLASDADRHVLTITPRAGAATFAVPRGLVPTQVRPERIAETVSARPGQRFWGAWARAGLAWGGPGAFTASDAFAHVYDRIVLFDPTRLAPSRQPYSFWGVSRFGRPAFTAEVRIDVSLTRPARQHGWGKPWGRNVWRRGDMGPLWRAVRAVRIAKAFRDTVWIDTRLYAPVTFSPGLRFGDAGFRKFGDNKRIL